MFIPRVKLLSYKTGKETIMKRCKSMKTISFTVMDILVIIEELVLRGLRGIIVMGTC